MSLNEKTRSILTQKLKFTPEQINQLEIDPDLRKKTLDLIDIVKASPKKEDVRSYAKIQFRKIKQSLNQPKAEDVNILQRARSEHYTFQRDTR